MRIFRLMAICMVMSGSIFAPAKADTVADLRLELNSLSAAVADLARELSSGDAASQPGVDGDLFDRGERIREELTRLTARTEELEFRIRRAIDEASNRLGDLEFRLTELEGGDPSAISTPRPLSGSSEPQRETETETPQLAASERVAFDAARDLAADGNYEEAASALQQFLEFYPGSPLGGDASLLLGEMHRARGAEPEAARAYLNLYLSAPDGPDAPRALLALGDSLARLEQQSEACVMFEELRERFADSPEAEDARAASQRLNCP